jgi:hypothetical protein
MNSQEEKDETVRPYPQRSLESPFLEEELFGGETEDEWELRLVTLQSETPFQHAFEQGRPTLIEPEELEEEFVEEEEQADADDYAFHQGDLSERRTFADHEFWDPTATLEFEAAGCTGDHELPDFEGELLDSEIWQGIADQIAFRDRVLNAHIALSRKRAGAAKRDLSPKELDVVAGTDKIKMGLEAAAAASRLLAAANADLAKAQAGGHADALRTIRLSATSGYRDSTKQKKLWLGYFAAKDGYYDRTQTAREGLADGPHSEQAIAYMLTPEEKGGFGLSGKIAAPGYSNHQGGIAIDFWQERKKGYKILNNSGKKARAKWRSTWFHEWLRDNAANNFGFRPIPTEEWHWEYRGGSGATASASATTSTGPSMETQTALPAPSTAQPAAPADYLGGKLAEFTATTALRVAVFSPKAASTSGEVDVLVYVHGLFRPCPPVPKRPADLITKAPFALGKIVDASNREIILVVPFLVWKRGEPHPLGNPAKLNRFVDEVLAEVGRMRGTSAPSLRGLILAGHSRAYDFLDPLAKAHASSEMARGALSRLTQVWALDTAYTSPIRDYRAWFTSNPKLVFHMFYRKWSWSNGKRVVSSTNAGGKEYDKLALEIAKSAPGRFNVTAVSESHCAVPVKRLPDLLATSISDLELETFDEFDDAEFGDDEFENDEFHNQAEAFSKDVDYARSKEVEHSDYEMEDEANDDIGEATDDEGTLDLEHLGILEYDIPAPLSSPTLGFELDLNFGFEAKVATALGKSPPAGFQWPNQYLRVTNHEWKDSFNKLKDGFVVTMDAVRMEIATAPFHIDDDATFNTIVKNVTRFGQELSDAKKIRTSLKIPAVGGHPITFELPGTVVNKPHATIPGDRELATYHEASVPLVIHRLSGAYPTSTALWSSPQATVTLPLAQFGRLVWEIHRTKGGPPGEAFTGRDTDRLGVRDDLAWLALVRAMADRRKKLGTTLSDGTKVTDADFTRSITSLVTILVMYMLTSIKNDEHDRDQKQESFAKGSLPLNVKTPFWQIHKFALTDRERFVFHELYTDTGKRENLFVLASGTTSRNGARKLFPAYTHRDAERFLDTSPTWSRLVDALVKEIPVIVTKENTVGKKGHRKGDEILIAPLSSKIDWDKTKPRIAVEMRRLGFAPVSFSKWPGLMQRLRSLAQTVNP